MATYDNGVYIEPVAVNYYGLTTKGAYFFQPNPTLPLSEMQPFFPDDIHIGLEYGYDYGVAFYYPTKDSATDNVTLQGNWLPLEPETRFHQIIKRSGAGALSIYKSAYNDRILNVHLGDLVPIEKRQRLYKFIVNIVQGALKKFEYEDETGTLYTVRCISPAVAWAMRIWLKYEIDIELHIISKVDLA